MSIQNQPHDIVVAPQEASRKGSGDERFDILKIRRDIPLDIHRRHKANYREQGAERWNNRFCILESLVVI